MSWLATAGVFLPSMICGILIVHLLWDELTAAAIAFKLCLGAGIGLGVTSLCYLPFLLAFTYGESFFQLEIAAVLLLLSLALRRSKTMHPQLRWIHALSPWQAGLMAVTLPILGFAIAGAVSVWLHRPYGTWDAFMIYNRTARFLYRGQEAWMRSFSPEIDPAFHADYPLLLQLDITKAWEALGHETQSVPRVLSAIFMVICAGTFASGITLLKSFSQALLGTIVLLNTPFFILGGGSQTADIPLTFFIVCAVALVFLYASSERRGLLVLAGLSAGLAAWTKNEGDVFLAGLVLGLLIAYWKRQPLRHLGYFGMGLAAPLTTLLYFKIFMAPANDILGTGTAGLMQRLFEWPRHGEILASFGTQILKLGGPWISVIPLLAIYALVFGGQAAPAQRPAFVVAMAAAGIQALGYYAIYLVTPHPVDWQLDFSLWRVLFHIYMPMLLVFFVFVRDVPAALGLKGREAAMEGNA